MIIFLRLNRLSFMLIVICLFIFKQEQSGHEQEV